MICDRAAGLCNRLGRSVVGRITLVLTFPILYLPVTVLVLLELAWIWLSRGSDGLREERIIP